jgi:hypothetical protein
MSATRSKTRGGERRDHAGNMDSGRKVRQRTAENSVSGFKAGLLTQLVGRYPVYGFMSFHGNRFSVIRVYGMTFAFAQKKEAVFFEVMEKIPAFDRHR